MATRKRDNTGRRRSEEWLEVVCRLAPFTGENACVIWEDESALKAVPPPGCVQRNGQPYPVRCFKFAHVFDEADNQRRVFDRSASDLIEQLITGKNGLLFTYGVTGSGKTYTMAGNSRNAGVLPRTLDVVFNSIHNRADKCVFQPNGRNGFVVAEEEEALAARRQANLDCPDRSTEVAERQIENKQIPGFCDDYICAVFVSYVEVYNNYIYDLLDDSSAVPLSRDTRVDVRNAVYVDGATEIEVDSADDALEVFVRGQERRRVSDTLLNKKSSRSHSVFTIRLVQAPFESDSRYYPTSDPNKLVVSQLSLVDLAGSERAKRTMNEGSKLVEAGSINNSLMTLRMCFEKLRANQRRKTRDGPQPVPYRDSKLTTLFKNYFEGSGKIRMIICVNPRPGDYMENLGVLEFGEESQAIRVEQAADVIVAQDGPRPPVPKRFYTRWNMEAERIDTSSQVSVAEAVPSQVPYLPDEEKVMVDRVREWAAARQQTLSGLFGQLQTSVLSADYQSRNALCLMDYRACELEEMQKQKLEDEAALGRAQAELRQAKREIVSLRSRLARYEAEDMEAVSEEERLRRSRKEDRERMKQQSRKLHQIQQIFSQSTTSSVPSVAQLRTRFADEASNVQVRVANATTTTQTSSSSTESRRQEREGRQREAILAGGPGFYNPKFHRRSKSAPRVLDHQPLHRVPTGGVLRARLPPNTKHTVTPDVRQLKKSSEYVLTHQNVDVEGNISTSIVKKTRMFLSEVQNFSVSEEKMV